MIFDRTSEDRVRAQGIINDKVRKNKTLTPSEEAILDRGLCRTSTINRIVDRILYMYGVIKGSMQIDIESLPSLRERSLKQWKDYDVFSKLDEENLLWCIYNTNEPKLSIIGALQNYYKGDEMRLSQLNELVDLLNGTRIHINPFLSHYGLNNIEYVLQSVDDIIAPTSRQIMAVQQGDVLYVYGAYNVEKNEAGGLCVR